MTAHPDINDLFCLLDKWRHFPAFPLEARSEVLFALFLSTVLENCESVGVKVKPHIIPQFPLRQNRRDPRTKKRTNHSNNVDFFALSENSKCAYLIELKTDMSSRRMEQDVYLTSSAEKYMDEILRDLKSIVQASSEKKKYFHLLSALSELGLISLPENLECKIFSKNSRGLKSSIDEISIVRSSRLEVVYVQPRKSKEDKPDEAHHYIYFDEFAEIVESQGKLGRQFACYLREWKTDPAKQPPD